MPRALKQYLIFIGSPSGLEAERRLFADRIDHYNKTHGEPDGILFKPIGWEDTLPGNGRPQALINEDLNRCDYAVFLFHNRWGSPAGPSGKVGTEEEWDIALEKYADHSLRNMSLFFKTVDAAQLKDPGKQLQQVLDFKKAIEDSKLCMFKAFTEPKDFETCLDGLLADWGRLHRDGSGDTARSAPPPIPPPLGTPPPPPSYAFWMAEIRRLIDRDADTFNPSGALFCAERAVSAAGNDTEWMHAEGGRASAYDLLGDPQQEIASYERIIARLGGSADSAHRAEVGRVLRNKGVRLGILGRGEEAIAVYDDLLSRFGTAPEPALREEVAVALLNKGIALRTLKRAKEGNAVLDDLIARFGTATEADIKDTVERVRRLRK